MMNTMLISSAAPNNLWGEAILTACFLQNRVPHKKTRKTPYEIWKGYTPDLKYLKVWGCLAKVMLPELKKRKIGSKTSNCIFIGYAEHSATYRFLVLSSDVLDSNTIVETKNAEFFERIFPLNRKICHASIETDRENNSDEKLRRNKRPRKKFNFGNDFYTYLVDNDPLTFF